jgi:hypothetical protein
LKNEVAEIAVHHLVQDGRLAKLVDDFFLDLFWRFINANLYEFG